MRRAARCARTSLLLLVPLLLLCEGRADSTTAAAPEVGVSAARPCDLPLYQAHLMELRALVERCTRTATAAACDAQMVGPDDRVAIASGGRLVSYAWLRNVLKDASGVDGKAQGATADALAAAGARLDQDIEYSRTVQSPGAAAKAAAAKESESATQDAARSALSRILSGSEFQHDTHPGLIQKWLASLRQWILDRLIGAAAQSSEARWIPRVLLALTLIAACFGFGVWVVRRSRRERASLFSFAGLPLPEFAGEKEWERWSREGRSLAEAGRWREAIHALYWAAIAALGARGAWPEDRARTPREYLAFLRPENVHRADLVDFTRSFEGIWYGHLPADEGAYRKALARLERLAAR